MKNCFISWITITLDKDTNRTITALSLHQLTKLKKASEESHSIPPSPVGGQCYLLSIHFLPCESIVKSDLSACSMTVAMKAQARWDVMDRTDVFYAGTVFIVVGTVLVVSSFLALGFTGTFLGMYQPQVSSLLIHSRFFVAFFSGRDTS